MKNKTFFQFFIFLASEIVFGSNYISFLIKYNFHAPAVRTTNARK